MTDCSDWSEEEKQFWVAFGKNMAAMRNATTPQQRFSYDKRRKVISQKKLGDIIGLSRPTIANMEGGRQRVDCFVFEQIKKALLNENPPHLDKGDEK